MALVSLSSRPIGGGGRLFFSPIRGANNCTGGRAPPVIPTLVITRHSLVKAKCEVLVLLYACFLFAFQRFLNNPRADSRQILHAGVHWFRICFLPFWGLAAPGGRKKGELNFRYYRSQWGISAFWRFFSNISATRGQIHAKLYNVYGQCLPTYSFPLWRSSVPGGGKRKS